MSREVHESTFISSNRYVGRCSRSSGAFCSWSRTAQLVKKNVGCYLQLKSNVLANLLTPFLIIVPPRASLDEDIEMPWCSNWCHPTNLKGNPQSETIRLTEASSSGSLARHKGRQGPRHDLEAITWKLRSSWGHATFPCAREVSSATLVGVLMWEWDDHCMVKRRVFLQVLKRTSDEAGIRSFLVRCMERQWMPAWCKGWDNECFPCARLNCSRSTVGYL